MMGIILIDHAGTSDIALILKLVTRSELMRDDSTRGGREGQIATHSWCDHCIVAAVLRFGAQRLSYPLLLRRPSGRHGIVTVLDLRRYKFLPSRQS